jgi:hypothetical protein
VLLETILRMKPTDEEEQKLRLYKWGFLAARPCRTSDESAN